MANKRLFIDREEVLTFEKIDTVQQSVQLVKFGQVFSPVNRTIPSSQEVTIWGQVRSVTPTEWTGIVEMTAELCERSSLLWVVVRFQLEVIKRWSPFEFIM